MSEEIVQQRTTYEEVAAEIDIIDKKYLDEKLTWEQFRVWKWAILGDMGWTEDELLDECESRIKD